ncbi:MAG: aminotransferase class I/II-fold pyridoxal phosphate-dependent enzyme [Oscillospiraceae bacterium]|nr:aminotransferase class I/II-fold pyridoxal phosphate-dependent enzyme [Oscillospiraceae bacterium]
MTEFEKKYYRDRRGTGCAKWDALSPEYGSELLSMWVADMDIACPDSVREIMLKAAEENLYGYFMPPAEWTAAFTAWEKERHGYEVRPEWLRHTHGVVTAIYRFLSALTQKGDACMILTPCYYPFMSAINDTGRRLVCSRLKNDAGYYTPDFEDIEDKIKKENVKALVLSSPHNPVGRVWTAEELRTVKEICAGYGVYIISDEIHQDITLFGSRHIPTALAGGDNDRLTTLTAATKTFNLAGLSLSAAIVENADLRAKYDEYALELHGGSNITGYLASMAAYRDGKKWLEGCIDQIERNAMLFRSETERLLPGAVLSPLEGTYLQWVDLSGYVGADELEDIMKKELSLAVDCGSMFFPPEDGKGDCHVRINLATSAANAAEAARRLGRLSERNRRK